MKNSRILLTLVAVISALVLAALVLTLSGSTAARAAAVEPFTGPAAARDDDCANFGSRQVPLCPEAGSASAPSDSVAQPAATLGVTLSEGFDDITLLPAAGWHSSNNSDPLGITGWFQGNSGVFPAQQGAPTAYIGANFNNTSGTGTISNWLLTPVLDLSDGSVLTFWTRSVGSTFPDRLQVRMSLNGASVDVGATATSVGDFTELLLDINPGLVVGGYPDTWAAYDVVLSGVGAPVTGRLAFRYFVENAGPSGTNADYIGIDTASYTAVPSISLDKTVGTDSSLCAPASEVSITEGTDVTYCYRLTNTGAVTLTLHDLVDSQLGTILSTFPYTFSPGASVFLTQTASISATTVNTATWTAYNAGPTDVVSTTAVATATVLPEPAIGVNPPALAGTQPPNAVQTHTLTISNTGTAPLNWEILEAAPAPLARPAAWPGSQSTSTSAGRVMPSRGTAADDLNCRGYENYIGAEPAGYSENCLRGVPDVLPNPSLQAVSAGVGYALDIGLLSDNFVTFDLNDFPGQTVVATNTLAI